MKLLIALLALSFGGLALTYENITKERINEIYPSVPLPKGKNCLKPWLGTVADCGEFWANYWTPVIVEYEFKFNGKDYKLTSEPHESKFYKFAGRVIEVKHYEFSEWKTLQNVKDFKDED